MQRKHSFVPGEYYHIYNRGIDKRIIFKSKNDYRRFIMLMYLANSTNPFRLDQLIILQHKTFEEILSIDRGTSLVSVGVWSLMPNHFHIILREEIEGGISQFMKKLGTGYSMFFNIKYERTGSLFGGPFKSKHVSRDLYLKHLFGYSHLNPLDIKFSGWEELIHKHSPQTWKQFLKEYPYSSCQDYIGLDRPEKNILNKSSFPEYFLEVQDFEYFIDSYLVFTP